MTGAYDIAVIGSGFSGSLIAMIARNVGLSVVLIDKGKHPRIVIGESSTPLTNLLLEELFTTYDLPDLLPLTKWGSWQNKYPGVACGLKRGFTFYHHDRSHPEPFPLPRSKQLLVAASPNNEIADTHWYRADFDHLLVKEAERRNVVYLDETNIAALAQHTSGWTLSGSRSGQAVILKATFLIDASGPRGFLHRALGLNESTFPGYPETQALYTHFRGVGRLDEALHKTTDEKPPYPIDDAAVHHVFKDGWIWVLHFNNGVTSAGVAAKKGASPELALTTGEVAWAQLLQQVPALQRQFQAAVPVRPFTYLPQLSFRSATLVGQNWAMLPSAAGFVDPLLSTGFPLTLLGVARMAKILSRDWGRDRFLQHLQEYASKTEGEMLATSRLIASLYANMHDFPVFSALSLLYFAAASYSEVVRRLSKGHLASSFLLHDHPTFGPAATRLYDRARLPRTTQESGLLVKDILDAIKPFNIAALGEPNRRNWYPVDVADLFRSAAKLDATHEELAAMLQHCGFPVSPLVADSHYP